MPRNGAPPASSRRITPQSEPVAFAGGLWAAVLLMLAIFLLCFVLAQARLQLPFENPASSAERLHAYLEIVYFVASASLPLLTVIAVYLAGDQFRLLREQTRQAESARLATIYIEISRRWDSAEFNAARQELEDLADVFDTFGSQLGPCGDPPLTASDFIAEVLRRDPTSKAADAAFFLLSFTEDLGLLCEREYISSADLNDIIGGGVRRIIQLTRRQIELERAAEPDPVRSRSRYAFTIWLEGRLDAGTRFTVPGHGAR